MRYIDTCQKCDQGRLVLKRVTTDAKVLVSGELRHKSMVVNTEIIYGKLQLPPEIKESDIFGGSVTCSWCGDVFDLESIRLPDADTLPVPDVDLLRRDVANLLGTGMFTPRPVEEEPKRELDEINTMLDEGLSGADGEFEVEFDPECEEYSDEDVENMNNRFLVRLTDHLYGYHVRRNGLYTLKINWEESDTITSDQVGARENITDLIVSRRERQDLYSVSQDGLLWLAGWDGDGTLRVRTQ